ncbi:hypothetical protein JOB18_041686 [Solea senegalensis]|uniref:Retrotransposon gag domain-containing protein n=1 Tax=Solea senegalensis TaxID=28829 RepID=A0AAV6REI0_SOLSE|nr:hypothetical protein JOB18_041686 [Solea senegalensis]
MDPAETETVKAALGAQGRRLLEHKGQFSDSAAAVQQLSSRHQGFQESATSQIHLLNQTLQRVLARLVSSAPTMTSPAAVAPCPIADPVPPTSPFSMFQASSPRLAPPEKFSGEPGRAAAWATAEWDCNSPACHSSDRSITALQRVFDHTTPALESMRQNQDSVADYAINFRAAAAESGWNDAALRGAFRRGLSGPIKDLLAPLEVPPDLDSMIKLSGLPSTREAQGEMAGGCHPPPPTETTITIHHSTSLFH